MLTLLMAKFVILLVTADAVTLHVFTLDVCQSLES